MSTKNDDLEIVALPYGFFCYDVRYPKEALIAQLDRVQVSEACGVGSSPAERTKFKNLNSKIEEFCSFNFHSYSLV